MPRARWHVEGQGDRALDVWSHRTEPPRKSASQEYRGGRPFGMHTEPEAGIPLVLDRNHDEALGAAGRSDLTMAAAGVVDGLVKETL